MTFKNFELYEDGDKYYELIPLYNAWYTRTMFMSVGNTNVEEWDRLMEYCVKNKKETAHFFIDLIDAYDKDENCADNYVGFFLDIVGETFKDDGIPIFKCFVCGDIAQRIYKVWVGNYIHNDPSCHPEYYEGSQFIPTFQRTDIPPSSE